MAEGSVGHFYSESQIIARLLFAVNEMEKVMAGKGGRSREDVCIEEHTSNGSIAAPPPIPAEYCLKPTNTNDSIPQTRESIRVQPPSRLKGQPRES